MRRWDPHSLDLPLPSVLDSLSNQVLRVIRPFPLLGQLLGQLAEFCHVNLPKDGIRKISEAQQLGAKYARVRFRVGLEIPEQG